MSKPNDECSTEKAFCDKPMSEYNVSLQVGSMSVSYRCGNERLAFENRFDSVAIDCISVVEDFNSRICHQLAPVMFRSGVGDAFSVTCCSKLG